jgi:hypothetical protein
LSVIWPEAVPAAALAQLRELFYANAARNLFLAKTLLDLLNRLETQQIRAIPFKGPVLAASAYGNLALRQFSDLDILVHERDISRAMDVFRIQGYCPLLPESAGEQADYFKSHYVCNFRRVGGTESIDLQWGITFDRYLSFPLDFDRLWQRLQPVSLLGATLRDIPPEDLLLFLCVHGCRHEWERLEWICDVAELIRAKPDLNWDQVIAQADRTDTCRMLLLGVGLASDLLGTRLPERIRYRTRSKAIKALAAWVAQRLRTDESDPARFTDSFFFSLRTRERLRSRVPYLIDFLRLSLRPAKEDGGSVPPPRQLSGLHCLVRLIRLVKGWSGRLTGDSSGK